MTRAERMPQIVAGVTLVAGGALAASPGSFAGPLGLDDHTRGIRAIGIADLVLVPGLAAGRPRWPWMAARAALSLAQAAYVERVARSAGSPRAARGAAATLLLLSVTDVSTAVALRRAER